MELEPLDLSTVNRSAVIIRMRQPFIDWANQLPDRAPEEKKTPYLLDELNREPTVYLVPEIFDPEEWDAYLETRWPFLFEHLLTGWTSDSKLWPKRRSVKMLHAWF